MKIDYCATIRSGASGIPLVLDFECQIDAELDWDNGEPSISITDVLLDAVSLYREDLLSKLIAADVANQAEHDEGVIEKLLEAEGIYYRGGANNPAGAWVRS